MIDIIAAFQAFVTANYLHANVPGIAGIPTIITLEDFPDNSNATERENGMFVYDRNDFDAQQKQQKENESYVINFFVAMPVRSAFIPSMIELKRISKANNETTVQPTEYYYPKPNERFELEDFRGTFELTVDRMGI